MLFWHQGICVGIYSIHNISWNQIIRHNIHISIWVTSGPGGSLLVLGPAVTGTLVVLGPEVRCPSGPGGPLVLQHRHPVMVPIFWSTWNKDHCILYIVCCEITVYCTELNWIVLYCIVLYCTVVWYSVMWCRIELCYPRSGVWLVFQLFAWSPTISQLLWLCIRP